MESIQDKLSRVRKPRVHITYEVETEGATVEQELPFVVGVLGAYSGDNSAALHPLKDRKFVQIDPDNFDQVMAHFAPSLSFQVENTLQADGSQLGIDLQFKSMDDFEPASLVKQIAPLNELLEQRNKLRDLMAKVDRYDELGAVIEQILANPDNLKAALAELGATTNQTDKGV
jgi:type VI secretion system protein ImpB